MKLAVAIADEKAGSSAFVVWRGFEESMKKASEYGYDGVELALRSAVDADAGKIKALLQKYHLEASAISTGQTFADLNLYLTVADSEKRTKAIEVLSGLIELAEDFGGIVNLGRVRGFVAENQTIREASDIFTNSLGILSKKAESHGVTVIVEPVNRYEINFINSVGEASEFLREAGIPNVGIMPDVFHMNIEDASIGGALRDAGNLVKYVHLADSNRLAPGWGHLDFGEVFKALKDINFNGWVSVEILPLPTPDEAALQAAKHLLPLIEDYNRGGV